MKGPRCLFGWHDYIFVGFKWEQTSPGVKSGWDHECSRCGDKISLGHPR